MKTMKYGQSLLVIILTVLSIVGMMNSVVVRGHNNGEEESTFQSTFKFQHPIHINVYCIGFSQTAYSDLNTLLERSSDNTNTPILLNTFETIKYIEQKYIYNVKQISGGEAVKEEINQQLRSYINKYKHTSSSDTSIIPYNVIDDIIYKEYQKEIQLSNTGPTIYLINSDIGKDNNAKYMYSQLTEPQLIEVLANANNMNSNNFNEEQLQLMKELYNDNSTNLHCYTKMWQSKSPSQEYNGDLGMVKSKMNPGQGRYVWIDIGSDFDQYGPLTKGSGTVMPDMVPSKNVQGGNALGGSGTSNGRAQQIMDIGTFVSWTTRQLISPPIAKYTSYAWDQLEIRLVMVHDHVVDLQEVEKFDWQSIKTAIKKMPLLEHQSITFSKVSISLLGNVYAAQAKTQSLRVHHSAGKGTQSYLDSKELHYWLSSHNLKFSPDLDMRHNRQVLPIFLFDISFNSLLLLDRMHQAVSFPDMVIAIQTQSERVKTDFRCGNHIVSIDPMDATRPVLASLLETIWGITPTHTTWTKKSESVDNNYLWSMGNTPFSVFSTQKEISFTQRDMAIRNYLYFYLQDSLSHLVSVFQHIDDEEEAWAEFNSLNPNIKSIYELNSLVLETLKEIGNHMSFHRDMEAYDTITSLEGLTTNLTNVIFSNHIAKHRYLDCKQPSVGWYKTLSISVTTVLFLVLAYKLVRSKLLK